MLVVNLSNSFSRPLLGLPYYSGSHPSAEALGYCHYVRFADAFFARSLKTVYLVTSH
jgi:hypothetical protein